MEYESAEKRSKVVDKLHPASACPRKSGGEKRRREACLFRISLSMRDISASKSSQPFNVTLGHWPLLGVNYM